MESPSANFNNAYPYLVISSLPLAALTRSEALQRRHRKVADLEQDLGEDLFEFIDDPYQSVLIGYENPLLM